MHRFLRKHAFSLTLSIVGALLAGFLATALTIGREVDRLARQAQSRHAGDRVTAEIALAGSPQAPLQDRNRAIWALGQLGSAEALPVLQSLVTGEKCKHDSAVCQHELAKAIDFCTGDLNLGAMVWRH